MEEKEKEEVLSGDLEPVASRDEPKRQKKTQPTRLAMSSCSCDIIEMIMLTRERSELREKANSSMLG